MLRRLLPERGPVRVLATVTFVNTIGNGLWMASSALYLTRIVGLNVTQVGLALTVAALVSLVASVPLGYAADRLGPRGLMVGFYLAEGFLTPMMLGVSSFAGVVAVASLTALVEAGGRGARGAMIAGAIPPGGRVRARAYLRATTNVGIALGAGAAGLALAVDTPAAYRLLIVGNAISFVAGAAVALRLPSIAPVRAAAAGPRLVALRDRPYLAFVALDGLVSMHFDILNIVLPLWIVTRTDAPAWLVGVLFLVNTSMVVAFQVRAARGTEDVSRAARAARGAGLLIAAACLIFAASEGVPGWAAAALLVSGAFVHVLGELRQSAAGWGISFGLAPAHAHGQYQATYSMGMQLGRMIAPAVLTWLALERGQAGWLALAVLFAALGSAVPPTVRWAQRRRAEENVAQALGGHTEAVPTGR